MKFVFWVPTSLRLFPLQLLYYDIHCLEKRRHSWLLLDCCHWPLPCPLIVHHWRYLLSYLPIKHFHIQMCLISSQRCDWWKVSHKSRSRPWHGKGVVHSTDDMLSTHLNKLSGCSSWHLWCRMEGEGVVIILWKMMTGDVLSVSEWKLKC